MTYHLSADQYQRGVDYIACDRLKAVAGGASSARITGLAEMLAFLAHVSTAKVMRDTDSRLADLHSPLVDRGCSQSQPLG